MKIENCKIVFRCPQTWSGLTKTEDPNVRYCRSCDRGVHLCKTEDELAHANAQGWCVAVATKGTPDDSDDYPASVDRAPAMYIGEIAPAYRANKRPGDAGKSDT